MVFWQVTHIAPADSEGMIIGTPISAEGVILYPVEELGLCISMTTAKYRTTTGSSNICQIVI